MKTYKFFELSQDAQLKAMKTYSIDFYDCDLENLNELEIKQVLTFDRQKDNYSEIGEFIRED